MDENVSFRTATAVAVATDVEGVAQAAGFHTVAYQIEDSSISGLTQGATLISCRGTDRLFQWAKPNPWSDASSDVTHMPERLAA